MSAVWELFSKIERDGKKAAKCNLCLVELSGHLAGNAKKHLRIRHGIVTYEDAAEVQRKPNTLKQRLRELEAQKTALLEAVKGHNSGHVAKDFVLTESHTRQVLTSFREPFRAARSDKLDPVQHRNHNKEATKRWRQRLACLNQLEKEVEELKAVKAKIVKDTLNTANAAHVLSSNATKAMRPLYRDLTYGYGSPHGVHMSTTLAASGPSAFMGHCGAHRHGITSVSGCGRCHQNYSLTAYASSTFDSLSGVWLTQPQNFITTRTIITALTSQSFDIDWFVANYIEKHMQMHHGSNKSAALAHLNRRIQTEGSVCLHDDVVVTADDAQIKACLDQQCSKDIQYFHAGHQAGFVFEFGQERLGGIFVRFDVARRALCLHHPFLRRDLLCSTYTLQLVAALLKSPFYADLGLERIEVAVPMHLLKHFEPVLDAVRATPMQDRREVARFYGGEPRYVVGYSCSVSSVLRLLYSQ